MIWRTALPALLAAALAAVDAADPAAPTALRWSAGRTSLADAVARLAAGGNRVFLAPGVDDQAEADLPAVDGVWWEGVRSVCLAYGLRPDEGDPADDRLDGQGVPVPVGHGGLVLSAGRTPAMQTAGGLMVVAETTQALAVWVRAEPHVPRGHFAWGRAEAVAFAPPVNAQPEAGEPDADRSAAIWGLPATLPAGPTLQATIQVAVLQRWQASTVLVPGKEAQLDAQGRTITALLVTAADPLNWQGAQLPERRPLLAISMPDALAQSPQVRLRSADADLGMRSGGSRSGIEGRTMVFRYPRNLPEGRIDLLLEGRCSLQPQRIDASLALNTAAAEAPAVAPEAASLVSWDAGTAPMSAWLQRLAATGNPVLAEVGVDTTAAIELPAVHGRFWDGVLVLCRASGLAPAFTDASGIGGGAVRLIRRPLPPLASCGPFLVMADNLRATAGAIDADLRYIVEPRLQPEAFGPPEITWSTWAEDETGGSHPMTMTPSPQPGRVVAQLRVDGAMPATHLGVRVVHKAVRSLAVSGMLTVPRVSMWRSTLDVVPGQPGETLLGGHAVEVAAHAAPVAINGTPWGPGLIMRGLVGAQALQCILSGAEGQEPEQAVEANRQGGQQPGRPWMAWCRVPANGRMSVTLAARAALQPLVLPMRLVLTPPEGL